jgi:hypothetical protein
LIISVVFCLVFATFISQYIPFVPKSISHLNLFGYELNKFGFTLIVLAGFYFIKNILTYIFLPEQAPSKNGICFISRCRNFIFLSLLSLLFYA